MLYFLYVFIYLFAQFSMANFLQMHVFVSANVPRGYFTTYENQDFPDNIYIIRYILMW